MVIVRHFHQQQIMAVCVCLWRSLPSRADYWSIQQCVPTGHCSCVFTWNGNDSMFQNRETNGDIKSSLLTINETQSKTARLSIVVSCTCVFIKKSYFVDCYRHHHRSVAVVRFHFFSWTFCVILDKKIHCTHARHTACTRSKCTEHVNSTVNMEHEIELLSNCKQNENFIGKYKENAVKNSHRTTAATTATAVAALAAPATRTKKIEEEAEEKKSLKQKKLSIWIMNFRFSDYGG